MDLLSQRQFAKSRQRFRSVSINESSSVSSSNPPRSGNSHSTSSRRISGTTHCTGCVSLFVIVALCIASTHILAYFHLICSPPITIITSTPSIIDAAASSSSSRHIPLIDLINTRPELSCPEGLERVNDTILLLGDLSRPHPFPYPTRRHGRIPRLIHVTSKSRCMAREFVDNLERWRRLENYSFFVHNDDAVDRLLQQPWPEFPGLHPALRCTKGGAGKADVWRALVLWEYGGVYTDLDNAPAQFNGRTIVDDDEAFFVLERSAHLSQYFFAAQPRHPLLFVLLQHMIQRLLSLNDVHMQVVSLVTGPGALREAVCTFLSGQGPNYPLHRPESSCWLPRAGRYTGWHNVTLRAVGHPNRSNEWVARDVIPDKHVIYRRMNMTYFRDLPKVESQRSCLQVIYEATTTSTSTSTSSDQRRDIN